MAAQLCPFTLGAGQVGLSAIGILLEGSSVGLRAKCGQLNHASWCVCRLLSDWEIEVQNKQSKKAKILNCK